MTATATIDTAVAYGNERQALPSEFDRTLEAYRALETLLADGKVCAIGVSNFMVPHLTTLLGRATVVLAVNQIECHPYFAQRDVQDFGAKHGILTQAELPEAVANGYSHALRGEGGSDD